MQNPTRLPIALPTNLKFFSMACELFEDFAQLISQTCVLLIPITHLNVQALVLLDFQTLQIATIKKNSRAIPSSVVSWDENISFSLSFPPSGP